MRAPTSGPDVAHPAQSPSAVSGATASWVPGWVVALLVLVAGALLYVHFREHAASLWYTVAHDRNGHYRRSQNVAYALRDANPAGLIREVHAATVWPPLHPLVTGAVLAVGGIDYRLAVLPSLAAWAATCWLAFALARRLAPCHKVLAGAVALLFTAASPAHRAFATDIMLESLGAALTLAALYFYVSARQDRSAWRGRCFALALLGLFLTKYNYWTLLAAGLVLGALVEFRVPLRAAFVPWVRSRAWWRGAAGQLRHPLTYLLVPALGLAVYVKCGGAVTGTVAGWPVSIRTLDFPAQLCFVLLLLRVLPWWWRSGRHAVARLPVPARELVRWHAYPLAVWFLWPRRLGVFLWYVTFGQHGRAADSSGWTGNLAYYWEGLARDYHAGAVSLVVVLVLVALALVGRGRREVGSGAVLMCLAVAALLTNYHSANRCRFLLSWLAVGWVVAGVGAAVALGKVVGEQTGTAARRFLRRALVLGVLAGFVALQWPALGQPGHAEEGGMQPAHPSLLALADALGPDLAGARRPVVAAGTSFQMLFDWRLSESHGPRRALAVLPQEVLTCTVAAPLDDWLGRVSCDLLLVLDAPPDPGSPPTPGFDVTRLRANLASSGTFVLVSERHFPAAKTTAQIWRPAAPASASLLGPR